MTEWQFDAIGTPWTIVVDGAEISAATKTAIQAEINRFDQTYSRFIGNSMVSQLAESSRTEVVIDNEFKELLELGLRLSTLTHQAFDLNTAALQEAYGYDPQYSFKNVSAERVTAPPGRFWLEAQTLHKEGLVKLDFGAFGKGYLIDLVAKLLEKHGHLFYIVDGGRDFYATHKADGTPWAIALEHPTKSDEAIGVVSLKNQGLACSNSHHRRVGNYHHLLQAQTGQPIREIASVYVLAKNAFLADGISTALFVSDQSAWSQIIKTFPCQYLIVKDDLSLLHSPDFPGEIFE